MVLLMLVSTAACGKKNADDSKPAEKPAIGYTAPSVSEKDLSGNTVSLSDYSGKVIVLNFWGIWCPYCVKEMPEFSQAAQDYPDVTFLMINVSNSLRYEDPDDIGNFLDEYGLSFDHVLLNTSAATDYQVRSFPSTFIIDQNGEISYIYSGQMSYAKLTEQLDNLLK